MQFNKKGNMGKRSLYYASDIIFHSLPSNGSYDDIPNLIMINIFNYKIINHDLLTFKNDKEFNKKYKKSLDKRCHSIYTIKEISSNEEEIFENTIKFHFIELPKFLKEENIGKLNLYQYRWIKFLLKPEAFYNDKNNLFKDAINVLKTLRSDEDFLSLYYQKQKEYIDFISAMKQHGEEQRIKGIIEGVERGIKKGEEIGRIEEGRKKDIEFTLMLLKDRIMKLEDVKEKKMVSENKVDILNNFLNSTDSHRNIKKLAVDLNIKKNVLKEILPH
eukprot:jgi/Orpsp1_1/1182720/evm.model.c7180000082409.1